MKKNAKKNNSNFSGELESYALPNIVDMDTLSYYDDEYLDRYHSHLQAERENAIQGGGNFLAWEVEICYAQREIRLRNGRRIAHDKYIRSNPELLQDSNYSFE